MSKCCLLSVYLFIHSCKYIKRCAVRLSDRLNEITDKIEKIPPKKYTESITNLMTFVNNVEGVLLSEHTVISDKKTMEEQVKKFQDLGSTLKKYQDTFDYVNSTGHELITKTNDDSQAQRLRNELQDLNTKWSDIPIILEERQQNLLRGSETMSNDIQ